MGLIGGPLAFVGGVLVLFGAFDEPSGPLFSFTAVEVVWEASLAIFLTVKGYRPSPLLAETIPRVVKLGAVEHDVRLLPGMYLRPMPDEAPSSAGATGRSSPISFVPAARASGASAARRPGEVATESADRTQAGAQQRPLPGPQPFVV